MDFSHRYILILIILKNIMNNKKGKLMKIKEGKDQNQAQKIQNYITKKGN